jgi:nitroimidazol reductase NimA-like FMN-containing flavoprotein (pyridoxamine 5'-phosphate oxidase superfamily)
MKLEILCKNPTVCFEVDTMTDMRNWQSIIVFGKFEELKGERAKTARNILFDKVFSLLTSSTIHAHEHEVTGKLDDSNRLKYVMCRIKIKKVTGRFKKG